MIYLVFGRRTMGKTTLGYWIARRQARALVFDPRGLIGPPEHRARTAAQLAGGVDAMQAGEESLVVYTAPGDVRDGFAAFAAQAAALVDAAPGRPLAVLIDEAGLATRALDANADIDWLLRCSRPDRVHVILTAHRPTHIPTSVRAIADQWLMFRMRQEHDLEDVAQHCSPATAARVADLAPREFVRWDDRDATLTVHRSPENWYVPLGAGLALPVESGR